MNECSRLNIDPCHLANLSVVFLSVYFVVKTMSADGRGVDESEGLCPVRGPPLVCNQGSHINSCLVSRLPILWVIRIFHIGLSRI